MSGFERLEKKIQQQHPGERYGDVSSFFHGSGIEIADFRKYTSGDAPRQINRKLSAKYDEFWINTYHEDTDMGIHLWLDVNNNWQGGTYMSHWSIVREWLADYMLFAKKNHLQATHVRYIGAEDELQSVVCRTDRDWIMLYMQIEQQVLVTKKKRVYSSSLETFLQQHVSRKRKQIYILFSDFLDRRNIINEGLSILDARHSVLQVILQVPDFV